MICKIKRFLVNEIYETSVQFGGVALCNSRNLFSKYISSSAITKLYFIYTTRVYFQGNRLFNSALNSKK